MEDINEMIKSAQAEEEKERDTKFVKDIRKLKVKKQEGRDSTVTITLDEYLVLKAKEMDLERIVRNIIERLTLSYNTEYLTITESQGIVNAFEVLFPEAYERAYEAAIDKYTQEKKEDE